MAQGGREQTVVRVLRPGKYFVLLPYRSYSLYNISIGRRKKPDDTDCFSGVQSLIWCCVMVWRAFSHIRAIFPTHTSILFISTFSLLNNSVIEKVSTFSILKALSARSNFPNASLNSSIFFFTSLSLHARHIHVLPISAQSAAEPQSHNLSLSICLPPCPIS